MKGGLLYREGFKIGLIKFITAALLLMLLPASGCGSGESHEVMGNDLAYHLHLVEKKPLVELAGENIILFAGREKNGIYSEIVLVVGEREMPVAWEIVADPFCAPELILADLCRSGRDELVVLFLSPFAGTGYYQVHVIDPLTFMEIHVADPLEIIRENVCVSLMPDLVIELEGKRYSLNHARAGSLPQNLSATDCFGSALTYVVDNNRLKAVLPGLLPPSTLFGELVITYNCKEGALRKESMDFILKH